jgi:hypothetical protein
MVSTAARLLSRIRFAKLRPALFLAILIYVGFDFALPALPGAFVFDAAGSVESVDVARSRSIARIVVLATPVRDWSVPPRQPRSEVRQRLPSTTVASQGRPVVIYLARAASAPSRPAEDPH